MRPPATDHRSVLALILSICSPGGSKVALPVNGILLGSVEWVLNFTAWVIVTALALLHILNLLKVQDGVADLHVGRRQHKVELAARLTEEVPVLSHSFQLIFHHKLI